MHKLMIFFMFLSTCFGKNIVTCDFFGQLGNQLFQAAATIGYALDHDCDYSFPELPLAMNGELNMRYVFYRINTAPFPENTQFTLHRHIDFVDTFYYAPIPYFDKQNVRLHAHFASEKYFMKHRSKIVELFAPSDELRQEILSKYGHLLNGPTVAVHVRTYLPDGFQPLNVPRHLAAHRWHYFLQALALFPDHYRFLIFTDHPTWTKRNFPKTNKNLIFIEGNPHYFDFYLMSLCDHQIISPDSTFSWWAAWLNQNPNKVVVISDLNGGVKESDMICEGWTVVPKYPPKAAGY